MNPNQVYREGAYQGIIMGAFLTVTSILSLLSYRSSTLSILATIFIVGVPFLQFRLMAGVYDKYRREVSFSSLWMLGIAIFIGGSLICALVTYGYLEFVNPDYFYTLGNEMLATLEQTPELRGSELHEMIRFYVDENLFPSAIGYCVEMVLLTVFSGSILSMILAPVVKLVKRQQ